MNETVNLDRAHALMMAVLDGECTDAERQELEALLARRPELGPEWQRLRRVKEVTATMALRQPPEEVWDRFSTSVWHRVERGLGWLLVSAGAAILAGWWLWGAIQALLRDTGTPVAIRAAIVAVGLGLLILAVSVIRERWLLHRRDPYSHEVTR